jgi:hypothetical protein
MTPKPTATTTPSAGIADLTFLIGSAIGMQGESTTFDVVLQTSVEVIETQNDIMLGPELRIASEDLGQLRCAVNPDIDKDETSFTLHCDEPNVCTLRTLVRSFDNVDPIPNGSTLYTCDIEIAHTAADGTYPLACAISSAIDPDGTRLSTACIDGSVDVGDAPLASPTPTNTALPPPATVTNRPTSIPTASPHPRHNDGDGCECQVSPSTGTRAGWMLAFPAALLWLRRRRLSSKTRTRHRGIC